MRESVPGQALLSLYLRLGERMITRWSSSPADSCRMCNMNETEPFVFPVMILWSRWLLKHNSACPEILQPIF